MPTISLTAKIALGVLAGAAGLLAGVLGNALAPNVVYRISKRGRPPTVRTRAVWAVFCGSATISVIVGTVAALAPMPQSQKEASVPEGLQIVDIAVAARGPLWNNESLDKDEVVAVVRGTGPPGESKYPDSALVAFWRLAASYETNWHVGRRRVGGHFELALLPAENASSEEWEFFVGGIECSGDYSGDVGIVVLLVSLEAIEASASDWLDDRLGWGFEDLPSDGVLRSSQMKTVQIVPLRD